MSNPLYEQIEGNKNNQFNTFMQNPYQYLMNRRINIPQEYMKDPHSAVQYLLNNGQMNQGAFNKIFSTLQKMGLKFS